jgi:replication initiation and membrane attachment protein
MKIANMLQFTEKHRFCVFRDFSLGSLHHKMLICIYQPMIGGQALALYQTLHGQLPADRAGYSSVDQQRRLFLSLDLEQGERGRAALAELATRLEGIGLMRTHRRYDPGEDDYMYEYALQEPLSPNDFFRTEHLVWYLHDKVGKQMLTRLREELLSSLPPKQREQEREDISAAFYDMFRMSPFTEDEELSRILDESAAAQSVSADAQAVDVRKFSLEQILLGITHFSENRQAIERLADKPEPIYDINFIAAKYGLDLADVRWIIDMSGMFDKKGSLLKDRFEQEARLLYVQREKRSDRRTVLTGQREQAALETQGAAGEAHSRSDKSVGTEFILDMPDMLRQKYASAEQYSQDLRNSGYIQILKIFLPDGITPEVRESFLEVNTLYGLPDEVINVLIHFIHVDGRRWESFPIRNLASDMSAKQIKTYEAAVKYILHRMKEREEARAKAREASTRAAARPRAGGTGKAQPQKPRIPIAASDQGGRQQAKPTDKELEEMRLLARKLEKG